MTKEGRVISHKYRRDKFSTNEPPLQPRLKIFGVRPPARAEDYQAKSEQGKFSRTLREPHMANARLAMSQQKLRSEIKDLQSDIDLYLDYLDDKMDLLASTLGIQGFE